MNTHTAKLLFAVLVTFALLTIINVVVHIFDKDYETETAVAVSASNSVTFKGVYIREEEPLLYNGGGILSYVVEDGGRLSKDEVAAYVYSDEKQIRINERIEEIDSEISLLKKIQNPGTQEVAQPAYLASLIDEAYENILYYKENKNLSQMSSQKEQLLMYLSTMQYVTQEVYNFSDKIASLEAEKHNLENQQSSPQDEIKVPYSAYFVSSTDGYEKVLTFDKIETLTASQIKNIGNSKPDESGEKYVGKLIKGYKWKIIGVIEDSLGFFQPGNSIKLYFPSSDNTLEAVIESIREGETHSEKIITILCTDMSYDYVQNRVETIEIQDDEYKGIRVPREAIRVTDEEYEDKNSETGILETKTRPVTGVYIKRGERILFKKIDVIFQGDDFVVSKVNPDDSYVQLYDDTIVGGLSIEGGHLTE